MAPDKSARSSRDNARQAHAKQLAAEKRRSRTITWTIVGVIAAVVAIVVIVTLMNSSRSIPDAGPAPTSGTVAGGIYMDDGQPADGDAPAEVNAETVEEPNSETAGQMPTEVPGSDTSDIIIYADANCVHCAQFETTNSEALEAFAADGRSIEYRLVSYLDNPGTQNFSSRAANAMTCVAQEAPEAAREYIHEVFASYNTHQGAGLSNDELIDMAGALDVDVDTCVSENTYRPFVNYTTAKAVETGIMGTPSVWVNGKHYGQEESTQPFQSWAEAQLAD